MALTKAQLIDLNGNELILDLDADTSITADTDDQIDIKIGGADDFRFTANTFTALSGSTIAAQALTATTLTTTGAIAIANDGNIGSAGDADAIAISSSGVVTFSQSPVFPDGSLAVVDLDIDGATDIGANLADADLFVVDDGAGGTNRKMAASRIATYVGASAGAFSIANLDIDGGTDIGAALVDADEIIVDDGGGGTNRRSDMSRVKTYIADVTLTTAAQTNITSLGTLTALTVDDVAIDGKVVTMTGSTDDTFVTTVGTNGATSLVTTDTAAAAANLTITADGTVGINSTGDMTLDSSTDIIFDADGGDFSFKDGGTEILKISNSSSDVIIKPIVDTKDLIFQQRDGTEVARIEDNATFNVVTGKLAINGTAITSTAAELNLLDGVSGLVQADLTKLAAIDATATELNFIDGGATIGTTAIADGDGIIHNDGGTMKVTTAATFKTYFQEGLSSNTPSSADGQALGSASLEWSDLFLADGGIIYFGNDQDITLTHDADVGLKLKHTATADDKPIVLTLQTGETDMAANDVMGAIRFQAPDEGTGTDAILTAAAIQAVAEGDFAADNNATRLEFHTGASEAAASKMTLSSGGVLDVDGGITVDNITIDGTEIDLSSGDLTLDVAGDIILDADGGDVIFKDGGTDIGSLLKSGTANFNIKSLASDADVIIKGNDGGSEVQALQFDMSEKGEMILGEHGRIKYPTTANVSTDANTLDDYQEGAFNLSSTQASNFLTGFYTKIGRMVWFTCAGVIPTSGNSATQTLTGLPFAVKDQTANLGGDAGGSDAQIGIVGHHSDSGAIAAKFVLTNDSTQCNLFQSDNSVATHATFSGDTFNLAGFYTTDA